MIHGLLTGDLLTTDGTFTIDQVKAIFGPSPVTDPSDTVTVTNVHAWAGDDNGRVVAVYCVEDEVWEVLQITCPSA